MRLQAYVESYLPGMRAGSELAAHALFRHLVRKGWEVHVYCPREQPQVIDGVVLGPPEPWAADWLYTHLFFEVPTAMGASLAHAKPLVYYAHNNDLPQGLEPDLLLANSCIMAERWRHRAPATEVLYPCPDLDAYRVMRTDSCVTRVGLSHAKGGPLFWQLVRLMPEQRFLGVKNALGQQVADPVANCEVLEVQADMRVVYERTRVLVLPSTDHETFGRTGVEALASGIPVVANGWPGIVEALGCGGLYMDPQRATAEDWVGVLRCLAQPEEYDHHSALARKRARELVAICRRQLARTVAALEHPPR